jgi:hypothetical protein
MFRPAWPSSSVYDILLFIPDVEICVTVYSEWYKKDEKCLCAEVTKHYAIKTYGIMEVQTYLFMNLALFWGEWLASLPDRFTSWENWIGGLVDPRASLDDV